MSFFDDLALGSRFHRAMCADTHLRIEPADDSPHGRIGFQMIVEGMMRAARTSGHGLKVIKRTDGGYQSVLVEFRQ